MSISQLGALIHARPDEAKALILNAIVESKGDRKKAAESLGTTHRSFYRFVEKLRLWDEIDRKITEHGFPQIPGPPRSVAKIKGALILMRGNVARAAKHLQVSAESLMNRIEELGILEELNEMLKNSKFPPIDPAAVKS